MSDRCPKCGAEVAHTNTNGKTKWRCGSRSYRLEWREDEPELDTVFEFQQSEECELRADRDRLQAENDAMKSQLLDTQGGLRLMTQARNEAVKDEMETRADRDRLQAELDALRADAALGAAVRGMAKGTALVRGKDEWLLCYGTQPVRLCDTPEAALGVKRDEVQP